MKSMPSVITSYETCILTNVATGTSEPISKCTDCEYLDCLLTDIVHSLVKDPSEPTGDTSDTVWTELGYPSSSLEWANLGEIAVLAA